MNNRTNMIKMGDHIADLRKQKGYTQKTLGDILDVSDKTVSKWEKGVVAPDITILSSLADTLGVTVEEILSGEEVKKIDAIETIDIYSNMTKRKLIKVFILFVLVLALCTFFVFRIEDYYSWHLTPLYSEGDISSKGYIISNHKESKILINKIFFNKEIPDNIKEVVVSLKNKDEEIYNKKLLFDNNLNKIMNSFVLHLNYDKSIEINDLELNIILYNTNNDRITYVLKY